MVHELFAPNYSLLLTMFQEEVTICQNIVDTQNGEKVGVITSDNKIIIYSITLDINHIFQSTIFIVIHDLKHSC